jgi:SAM-dependent methyltransferase
MAAAARRAHPSLAVACGSLRALPLAGGALAGGVSWDSIIHLAPGDLAAVVGELARVVRPGGPLLVAFQAGGGEAVVREDAHGTGHTLISHRHDPDVVGGALAAGGFRLTARVEREPALAHEVTAQAFLLAEREG